MDKQIDDSERISPAYVRKILKCKCGANKRPCAAICGGSELSEGFECKCSPGSARLPFIMHVMPFSSRWERLTMLLASCKCTLYKSALKEALTNEPGDTSSKGFVKFSYGGLG